MSSGWRMAAFGLLLASVAGCSRLRPHVLPPAAAQAPSEPAWRMAESMPPLPPLPPSVRQPVMLDASVPVESKPVAEAPPKRPRRHTRPAETAQDTQKSATQPATSAEPEVASNTQPSESSPIGQLSAASGDANTADRQTQLEQINAMENTLNGIHRSLSSDEQKTATLIRTFITRAREALKTDDLEGARSYSNKAKVLLQELTKP